MRCALFGDTMLVLENVASFTLIDDLSVCYIKVEMVGGAHHLIDFPSRDHARVAFDDLAMRIQAR